MKPAYKINNTPATLGEWQQLWRAFTKLYPGCEEIFSDGELTPGDIKSTMDVDRTKGLTAGDIARTFKEASSIQLFYDIKTVLDDHWFYLAKEIAIDNSLPYFLSQDRTFIKQALWASGTALQCGNEALRDDTELVREAVGFNGSVIQYASPRLQCDALTAFIATKNNGYAYEFLCNELKDSRPFALQTARANGWAVRHMKPEFKKDPEIALAAVHRHEAMEWIDPSFRRDRSFVLAAVMKNGLNLKFADPKFRSDREIVLEALRQNQEVSYLADESLRNDPEISFYIRGRR